MPYTSSGRLPAESASKLGHLNVIQSRWVQTLLEDFEDTKQRDISHDLSLWKSFDITEHEKLKYIWAVDGSYAPVRTNPPTGKEVAFIKTALLSIDQNKLEKIDKKNPHPLLLHDILKDSALFHATVLPLKNVKTSLGNNYDAVRHIIYDSMRVDEDGQYFQTLKWLVYKKWNDEKPSSPSFSCPHCNKEIDGLPYDSSNYICPNHSCNKEVFLTDMLGFHLDMEEDSASDKVVSMYMLIMEHLMLFTIVRLMWHHTDKSVFSDTLFIKDGPLALHSQYVKLIPLIREFIEFTKTKGRPIHIIGQEKTGEFSEHLATLAKYTKPKELGDVPSVATLTHDYVRREVKRTKEQSSLYGSRSNWGEKVYIKLDPDTALVVSIPTGEYIERPDAPTQNDLIGLGRIMATLPDLISRKYEGALYPIELANGVASMSSYPSSRILGRFIEDTTLEISEI